MHSIVREGYITVAIETKIMFCVRFFFFFLLLVYEERLTLGISLMWPFQELQLLGTSACGGDFFQH